MSNKTAEITITVSVDQADMSVFVTTAPYFLIIDPQRLKDELAHHMEGYDISRLQDASNEALISIIAWSVRGPFFTPDSALEALPLVRQVFGMSLAALPYCLSGVCNHEYARNYRAAKDAVAGWQEDPHA